VRNYYNARIAGVKVEQQHLHSPHDTLYDGVEMGVEEEDSHDPYVRDTVERSASLSRMRKHGSSSRLTEEQLVGSSGGNDALSNATSAATAGSHSGEEMSSEDDTPSVDKAVIENLTPINDTSPSIKPPAAEGADATAVELTVHGDKDDKTAEDDAATTSETSEATGATTTADETTTTKVTSSTKVSSGTSKTKKRKRHPDDPTVLDDSASSGSVSTTTGSFRVGSGGSRGVGDTTSLSRHHLHSSSRPYSSVNIPTVSEVIVRKVLNKVRKTRNISSLRMLMSLPKGRARRSKHDDITATVVDLSVSLLWRCLPFILFDRCVCGGC
jgi:hypothetical protein